MSITFSVNVPSLNGNSHYVITCPSDHVHSICDSFETAFSFNGQEFWCEACNMETYMYFSELEKAVPHVNVSSMNAVMLFERLGLDFDSCGTIEIDDLKGRSMVANVGRCNETISASQENNFVYGGVPSGYFENVCVQLVELADVAAAMNTNIIWS